jgi:hypothetical protein
LQQKNHFRTHFSYLFGSFFLLFEVLPVKNVHQRRKTDGRVWQVYLGVLVLSGAAGLFFRARAGAVLHFLAAGFSRASCLLGAALLFRAALRLWAFDFLGAAFLYTRSLRRRRRVLRVDHSTAECSGKQTESKFLHCYFSFLFKFG